MKGIIETSYESHHSSTSDAERIELGAASIAARDYQPSTGGGNSTSVSSSGEVTGGDGSCIMSLVLLFLFVGILYLFYLSAQHLFFVVFNWLHDSFFWFL